MADNILSHLDAGSSQARIAAAADRLDAALDLLEDLLETARLAVDQIKMQVRDLGR